MRESGSKHVWRICKRIYLASSLASLESWMHIAPEFPLPTYVAVPAEIPNEMTIQNIDEATLPDGWKGADPLSTSLRNIGTAWLLSRSSAVARVPSAVIPGEFNYLINPSHPDFVKIKPGTPRQFEFDPRMWKSRVDQFPSG